jgi:hypothetical protein
MPIEWADLRDICPKALSILLNAVCQQTARGIEKLLS